MIRSLLKKYTLRRKTYRAKTNTDIITVNWSMRSRLTQPGSLCNRPSKFVPSRPFSFSFSFSPFLSASFSFPFSLSGSLLFSFSFSSLSFPFSLLLPSWGEPASTDTSAASWDTNWLWSVSDARSFKKKKKKNHLCECVMVSVIFYIIINIINKRKRASILQEKVWFYDVSSRDQMDDWTMWSENYWWKLPNISIQQSSILVLRIWHFIVLQGKREYINQHITRSKRWYKRNEIKYHDP